MRVTDYILFAGSLIGSLTTVSILVSAPTGGDMVNDSLTSSIANTPLENLYTAHDIANLARIEATSEINFPGAMPIDLDAFRQAARAIVSNPVSLNELNSIKNYNGFRHLILASMLSDEDTILEWLSKMHSTDPSLLRQCLMRSYSKPSDWVDILYNQCNILQIRDDEICSLMRRFQSNLFPHMIDKLKSIEITKRDKFKLEWVATVPAQLEEYLKTKGNLQQSELQYMCGKIPGGGSDAEKLRGILMMCPNPLETGIALIRSTKADFNNSVIVAVGEIIANTGKLEAINHYLDTNPQQGVPMIESALKNGEASTATVERWLETIQSTGKKAKMLPVFKKWHLMGLAKSSPQNFMEAVSRWKYEPKSNEEAMEIVSSLNKNPDISKAYENASVSTNSNSETLLSAALLSTTMSERSPINNVLSRMPAKSLEDALNIISDSIPNQMSGIGQLWSVEGGQAAKVAQDAFRKSWDQNKLEISDWLENQPPSKVKTEMIQNLVSHLSNLGEIDLADAWRAELRP
jgi:hypothetical protein